MPVRMKIDVVSDVTCPWCVIGIRSLEAALRKLGPEVEADVHMQPFELNPQMRRGGESITEHFAHKYGSSPEQIKEREELIRARGEQVGFKFDMDKRTRVYNTFDAHRLLCWAEGEGKQRALKHGLFTAYFTEGRDLSDQDVLVEVAEKAGLDGACARRLLTSEQYAAEVRSRERLYLRQGIHAVPAFIINDEHLIQGGQPIEVFEQALRRLAADPAAA